MPFKEKVLYALIFLLKSIPLYISVHVPTRRFRPVIKMASPKARSSIRNSVQFKNDAQ